MTFTFIRKDTLPPDLAKQLRSSEYVLSFSYLSYNRGLFSSSNNEEYWIAFTNTRVLYKAQVAENAPSVRKKGVLPLEAIAGIEVIEVPNPEWCGIVHSFALKISTSKRTIVLYVPTKENGEEIQRAFLDAREELTRGGH